MMNEIIDIKDLSIEDLKNLVLEADNLISNMTLDKKNKEDAETYITGFSILNVETQKIVKDHFSKIIGLPVSVEVPPFQRYVQSDWRTEMKGWWIYSEKEYQTFKIIQSIYEGPNNKIHSSNKQSLCRVLFNGVDLIRPSSHMKNSGNTVYCHWEMATLVESLTRFPSKRFYQNAKKIVENYKGLDDLLPLIEQNL